MKELLFSCKNERIALENVLAFNQIRKCDEGINKYKIEIEDLKEEIKDILDVEGVKENYIDLIFNYKKEIKNLDTSKAREIDLNKKIKVNDEKINGFNAKIKELEALLESLKRVIFDSDDAKVIVETQSQIEVTNNRLSDLYNLVENLNNDNTTLLIEKEFAKNQNINSDFNTPEMVKVEISNELQRVSIEFEEVIKTLELSIREDIEFCMKKISNREKEIAKYEDRRSNIVSEFPEAVDMDFYSELDKLDKLFEELDLCLDSDSCDCECSDCECCESGCNCENDCNCDENCDCGCQEVNNEGPLESEKYSDTSDINITNDMVHVESIEKPEIELKEITEASDLMENEKYSDEITEENDDVEVDVSNSFSSIGSVPYIFSEGESLESIAEKVYPNKECWEAIYNYNKEEIDNYLTANGISNDFESIKTLASDKYLFAGIQLNIPTDANYKG